MTRHAMSKRVRAARGFMLLEALIAMLVFSFGVLGIVGLQAAMTKAQTQSKVRTDAALLAQQLIGAMWADGTNIANYATASCAGYARCNDWKARVAAALPNAATTVVLNGADVTITILWTPPNEPEHKYTTTSSVAINP